MRIQSFKEEKDAEVQRKFEIAMKSMIEKEKYHDIVACINKSPDLFVLTQKLKDFS